MSRSSTHLGQGFRLGLIGHPLSHSLSPKIHRAALQSCGLNGDYSLFAISPDDRQGLKDLLARVRAGDLHGLNVTIPHKQNVIPLLDELTPTVQAIGAVNTIYMRDDKLIGDNTDAPGFLSDLKKFLTTETPSHGDLNAIVLGAGGSARAVVYALLNDGWTVTIAARRLEQAQQLADSLLNYQLQVTNYDQLIISTTFDASLHSSSFRLRSMQAFSLLVNTTPLGMYPNVDQSPLPENANLPQHMMVYDLVYNPRETKLVKDARAQGLRGTTGLGMLIEQAALAFELWTGCNPSREIMRTSLEQFPIP